jgi:hypothetical protein
MLIRSNFIVWQYGDRQYLFCTNPLLLPGENSVAGDPPQDHRRLPSLVPDKNEDDNWLCRRRAK